MRAGGQGKCALTICSEPCLLALPSSGTEGVLRIYNLLAAGGNVLCELAAHKSPVVRVAMGLRSGPAGLHAWARRRL